MGEDKEMTRNAVLSACGLYRYSLGRSWGYGGRTALWVMLNPSTADAEQDDATIRRCIGFSRAWGYDGLRVVNLLAYRATHPRDMPAVLRDAIGPENDWHIERAIESASIVIAAWGATPFATSRARTVVRMITAKTDLHCLRLTKGGHPAHPVRLPASLMPIVYATRSSS